MTINCKGFGRKRSWPNIKVIPRHSPGGTEGNHENLNQDSRSPGPRIEPGTFRIRSRSVNRSTTFYLCWRSNPGRPVCSQTLYWLSYSRSQIKFSHLQIGYKCRLRQTSRQKKNSSSCSCVVTSTKPSSLEFIYLLSLF
jgi:hypothetical protein